MSVSLMSMLPKQRAVGVAGTSSCEPGNPAANSCLKLCSTALRLIDRLILGVAM